MATITTRCRKSRNCRARQRSRAQHLPLFYWQQGGQAAEQLLIRNGLHNALLRNEFILHYQPQLDLTTGRIVGAEAWCAGCTPNKAWCRQ